MTRTEALTAPFGEICDLASIYQIKCEGANYKEIKSPDQEIIPDLD